MYKLKTFLQTKPVFLLLLPLFFVLHGCVENFDFIPFTDALLLITLYLLASLVLFFLFLLFYRNSAKAGITAFVIMSFHFFFGGLHDELKRFLHDTFLVKYSFILPVTVIGFIVFFILVKRTKRSFTKLNIYLNIMLLLIVVIDFSLLVSKISRKTTKTELSKELTKCDSCKKPDIYFILADEYAGYHELKDIFHYDNSNFENELGKRGFHIIDESFSNYNYTPFSLASILNMEYLHLEDTISKGKNLTYSYQQIKNSKVIQFFLVNDYKFYNYSVFDFEGQPAQVQKNFLPVKTKLITSQTFLSRLQRDIWFNVITKLKSERTLKNLIYGYRDNNDRIYQLTWDIATKKSTRPKFIYTHLTMPHFPYFYDKNGKELPFERLLDGTQVNKEDYIGYLQYANKTILKLVDHIQRSSPIPPIIVLMGDHGFRHFTETVERKYYFMNFASVYFPDKNYSSLADSISSVNLFREILNSRFSQQLPLLKDSSVYLTEKN